MPGLRDHEVSLLKLVEKITNGSKIVINETGTAVTFSPGQLTGGKFSHDCSTSRSVIYYLEVAACLAPFCKEPTILQLKGCTHDENDNSVDVFRSVTIPLLTKLGIVNDEFTSLSFKIVSRSCGADTSGCVIFQCPTLRFLAPVDLLAEGLVKRVRGVFWSLKMNREFSSRFVEAARSVLNQCIEDVWVYSEHVKDPTNLIAPCYGASIMSETDQSLFKGVCAVETDPDRAEKLGKILAKSLLREISQDGVVDSFHQWIVVFFMALAQDHKISTALIGTELVEQFLLVRFKLNRRQSEGSTEEDSESEGVTTSQQQPILLECIGVNYSNTAKRTI
jgi:RNA 3'-terminal phosphate cyclase-like protein